MLEEMLVITQETSIRGAERRAFMPITLKWLPLKHC
jgi:hypothetical protein